MQTAADFSIRDEGSIVLFEPLNDDARDHLTENVQEDAQWWGGALVVEHRYARDLVNGLASAGFTFGEA